MTVVSKIVPLTVYQTGFISMAPVEKNATNKLSIYTFSIFIK